MGPNEGDYAVVIAVVEPSIGAKRTTAFLVDRNAPGLSIGKVEDKMGRRFGKPISANQGARW